MSTRSPARRTPFAGSYAAYCAAIILLTVPVGILLLTVMGKISEVFSTAFPPAF